MISGFGDVRHSPRGFIEITDAADLILFLLASSSH
jgi:hypothetical protein